MNEDGGEFGTGNRPSRFELVCAGALNKQLRRKFPDYGAGPMCGRNIGKGPVQFQNGIGAEVADLGRQYTIGIIGLDIFQLTVIGNIVDASPLSIEALRPPGSA